FPQLMFPNAQNFPTGLSQHTVNLPVACFIPFDFRKPKIASCFRHPAVPPATVPKATIHKHGEAVLGKSKIWLTYQGKMPSPASAPMRPENGRQLQFRVFVTLRPDRSHDLRTFLF